MSNRNEPDIELDTFMDNSPAQSILHPLQVDQTNAMKNALLNNQVDLVKQLLNTDFPVNKIVTKIFLEDLYGRQRWRNIDSTINKYLGNAYHPPYSLPTASEMFLPFNELLIWSVLTKYQSMAKLMFQHGDGALAKALVAHNMYQAMAVEAQKDENQEEEVNKLLRYAGEFGHEACELLDYCHRKDNHLTQQLLVHEMPNWSYKTCLEIAFAGRNHKLLVHPCAQFVLADLWLGGLRTKRYTSWKILFYLTFPFLVPLLVFQIPFAPRFLQFKSKEEIKRFRIREIIDVLSREGNHVGCRKFFGGSRRSNIDEGYVPENATKPGSRMKFVEFYTAPVTKYLSWSIAYFSFLLIYTYTLLIRTPPTPEWNELYVTAYIATFSVEKLRECVNHFMNHSSSIWISNRYWNLFDAIFIVEFFTGLFLRLQKDTLNVGRVLYCLNIIYWYIRILAILRVSKFFGPLITMISKMLKKMMFFVILLLVVMMSYGVFRQSLFFPNEEFSWTLVRDIFFKPNFMMYGEHFAETIDPPCGTADATPCVTARWLNPLVMTAYLLVISILMLNLLIAIFNSIFDQVAENSEIIWKFSRYSLVMEYQRKPLLPPPLVVLSHTYLFLKWCRRWTIIFLNDNQLLKQVTSYVSPDDLDVAIRYFRIVGISCPTFEKNSLKDLIKKRETEKNQTIEDRVRLMGEQLTKLISARNIVLNDQSYEN